uniref:Uncharacterized protein n=1 Tax=Musca domestica TaxID=7370 RepID=T1PHA9_MUSDO
MRFIFVCALAFAICSPLLARPSAWFDGNDHGDDYDDDLLFGLGGNVQYDDDLNGWDELLREILATDESVEEEAVEDAGRKSEEERNMLTIDPNVIARSTSEEEDEVKETGSGSKDDSVKSEEDTLSNWDKLLEEMTPFVPYTFDDSSSEEENENNRDVVKFVGLNGDDEDKLSEKDFVKSHYYTVDQDADNVPTKQEMVSEEGVEPMKPEIKEQLTQDPLATEGAEQPKESSQETANGRVIFRAHFGFNPENYILFRILGNQENFSQETEKFQFEEVDDNEEDHDEVFNDENDENTPNTQDELLELSKTTEITPPQQQPKLDLLKEVSSSGSQSTVLTNEYFDNMLDLEFAQNEIDVALESLQTTNMKLYYQLLAAHGNSHREYNGHESKQIQTEIAEMLSQLDKAREKLLELKDLEKKRNYHLLLEALIREIYGEK